MSEGTRWSSASTIDRHRSTVAEPQNWFIYKRSMSPGFGTVRRALSLAIQDSPVSPDWSPIGVSGLPRSAGSMGGRSQLDEGPTVLVTHPLDDQRRSAGWCWAIYWCHHYPVNRISGGQLRPHGQVERGAGRGGPATKRTPLPRTFRPVNTRVRATREAVRRCSVGVSTASSHLGESGTLEQRPCAPEMMFHVEHSNSSPAVARCIAPVLSVKQFSCNSS